MDDCEISYLLRRCCSHRTLAANAACVEARCVHEQFLKGYQRRLLELRRAKPKPAPFYPQRLAAQRLATRRMADDVPGPWTGAAAPERVHAALNH